MTYCYTRGYNVLVGETPVKFFPVKKGCPKTKTFSDAIDFGVNLRDNLFDEGVSIEVREVCGWR